MAFPSDLEIARGAALKPLEDISAEMGIPAHLLEPYGEQVVKIKLAAIEELAGRPTAKYVVVSAITPTPLGEGKTTTTVGLGQGFKHIGRQATVAIRQPSMGPTFGIKGGRWRVGQVVPMEVLKPAPDRGHACGHRRAQPAGGHDRQPLFQGNPLGLDLNIISPAALDVNDRALRISSSSAWAAKATACPRQTGFDITAASEVMATLAPTKSLADLRERLGRIGLGIPPTGPGHRRATRRGGPDGRHAARRDQAQPDADLRTPRSSSTPGRSATSQPATPRSSPT
jgi:formate--tetrahydrofolate ligase